MIRYIVALLDAGLIIFVMPAVLTPCERKTKIVSVAIAVLLAFNIGLILP